MGIARCIRCFDMALRTDTQSILVETRSEFSADVRYDFIPAQGHTDIVYFCI